MGVNKNDESYINMKNGVISVNLFMDTFEIEDGVDEDIDDNFKVEVDTGTGKHIARYRRSAVLTRHYLLHNFPFELRALSRHDVVERELYEKLTNTCIVMHLTYDMPDLSKLTLLQVRNEYFSSWRVLLVKACKEAMRGDEFCMGVRIPLHSKVLVTLISRVNEEFRQLHIYFNDEAVERYDEYMKQKKHRKYFK